ncbi:MAG: NADH-quinone oxidoreductase subunit NuoE [Ruminococcaceae bacterium]|nr:NADH-quinone oxidoreductase subunit NuoE [Oscillospiraceae bacterium]
MAKKKSSVPFKGTKEQETKLYESIAAHKHIDGCLMPILQDAQNIYGYLPIEVQKMIADALDIPLSEVYGVATFYGQFSLSPKGEYVISICTGTACYVKGAKPIVDEVEKELGIKVGETTEDGKFSIQDTRCLGCCGLAPVLLVNEKVYGRITEKDVKGILEEI